MFGAEDSVFTDSQLRAAIFSTYQKPDRFYWEDRSGSAPYYLTTWSLAPTVLIPWEELTTDDLAQARQWVDSCQAHSNHVAPVNMDEPVITLRYFEFEPIPTPGMGSVQMRVTRSSYIDRANGSMSSITGDAYYGALQQQPIDLDAARGIAEYVWYLGTNGYGNVKPLTSFSRVASSEIVHTIFSAMLTGPSEVGDPAKISLIRTDYHIDRQTGAVAIGGAVVRSIPPQP